MMAIEYPVHIKFRVDNNELSKVKKKVNVGGGVASKGNLGNKFEGLIGVAKEGLGKLGVISAVVTAIYQLIKPLIDLLQLLVFAGILILVKWIIKLVNWVKNIDFKKIWGNIKDYVAGLWESIKGKLVNAFSNVKEWISTFISNLKTVAFEKLRTVGQWIWENIIRPGWEFLKSIGKWIWESILVPAFSFLKDIGLWIWEKILKPAFDFLKKVGIWIWEKIIKPAFDYLKDVGKWIWEKILKPAFDFLSNIGEKIWNTLKGAFDYVKEKLISIGNAIKNAISKIPIVGKYVTGSKQFGGKITKDGLYMLHSGETVNKAQPQNNVVINISVNGNVDDNVINELSRKLYEEINLVNRW